MRQTWAQELGGLHPSMYTWLVFGRSVAARISPGQEIASRPTIGSVTGDASGQKEIERSRGRRRKSPPQPANWEVLQLIWT